MEEYLIVKSLLKDLIYVENEKNITIHSSFDKRTGKEGI